MRRTLVPAVVWWLAVLPIFAVGQTAPAGAELTPSAAAPAAPGGSTPDDEVPAAFAPFRHLVGSWKGFGIPEADRLRGWPETHAWAWKFEGGKPVGMSVTFKGNRALASGRLAFDPSSRTYRLEGTDPAGQPVVFVGAIDDQGRTLTLDRSGPATGGKQRLALRLNSNQIRYTLTLEAQEPGAPRFARVVETGLTKEGESFAARGTAASLPECIITGGAATLSVTYGGKTYPLCCTGCLDEFKANPEKYVRKASLRARAEGGTTGTAPPRRRPSDDAFEGLLGDDAQGGRPGGGAMAPAGSGGSADSSRSPAEPAGDGARPHGAPATQPAAGPDPDGEPGGATGDTEAESRARTYLRLGQALEARRQTDAALDYYRRVVKDFPGTTAAGVAAGRIKALDGKP